MRLLAACVCLLAGCTSPRGAEEYHRRAVQSLRNGKASLALTQARDAAARCYGASACKLRERLLEAEVLLTDGRREEAEAILSEPVSPGSASAKLAARRTMLQGWLLLMRGRLEEAKGALAEAEQAAQAAGALDVFLDVLMKQVELTFRLNRPSDAELINRRLLNRAREERDLYHEAAGLNNLGMMRLKQSRFDEAIPWLQQAMDAARRGGVQRLMTAAALNLGICYSRLGSFEQALAANRQAIDLLGPTGLATYRMNLLGEMGSTSLISGDARKAIPYYKQALALAPGPADKALWRRNMAAALVAVQDWDGAELSNREAMALASDPDSQARPKRNAAAIAAGRGQLQLARSLFQEAIDAAKNNPAVLWESHAGLADVYTALRAYPAANREFVKTLDVIDANLAALSSDSYKLTFFAHLIGFYQNYVKALVEQRAYDRALEVADSSRARILFQRLGLKGNPRRMSVRDYRQAARSLKSTLLFYWIAPRGSYLWIVTPSRVHAPIELPPAEEIQKQVDQYRAFIEKRVGDPIANESQAARRLYEMLVAPALPLIGPDSRVVLAPDGPLHWLNLETLPVYGATPDGKPHYWIEDVQVSVAPSLGILAARVERDAAPHDSVLIIGDPVSPGPEFPKLAYAADEVNRIRTKFASARKEIFTGADARPEVYEKAGPGSFKILHFSAHAVANQQSPLDSAIVLSRSGENFKLYARNILAVPLNADLVTISSCRSAGAHSYSGEGLVGFAWAFLQAGSRRVIAGLWDVTDSSTPGIMDVLYSRIEAGASPEAGLRESKLSMIRSGTAYRKPFYWGPFQLYIR